MNMREGVRDVRQPGKVWPPVEGGSRHGQASTEASRGPRRQGDAQAGEVLRQGQTGTTPARHQPDQFPSVLCQRGGLAETANEAALLL